MFPSFFCGFDGREFLSARVWRRSLILAIAFAISSVAIATTVVPPTFEALVDDAEQICRLQVTRLESRASITGGRKVVHTYVHGKVVRPLKGELGETIVLRLLGGKADGVRMSVVDMPTFRVGETHVVFLRGNGRAFCPLVGVMYGGYRVERNAQSGEERVLRSNGEPLRQTSDVRTAMSQEHTKSGSVAARAAGGAAMTVNQFEHAIVQQVAARSLNGIRSKEVK